MLGYVVKKVVLVTYEAWYTSRGKNGQIPWRIARGLVDHALAMMVLLCMLPKQAGIYSSVVDDSENNPTERVKEERLHSGRGEASGRSLLCLDFILRQPAL